KMFNNITLIDSQQVSQYVISLQDSTGLFNSSRLPVVFSRNLWLTKSMKFTRFAVEALNTIERLDTLNITGLRNTLLNLYSPEDGNFKLRENLYPTPTSTADALAIFNIIGFPEGFKTEEFYKIVNYFAKTQEIFGGWYYKDNIFEYSHYSSEIVKVLHEVDPLSPYSMNLNAFLDFIDDCKITRELPRMIGYTPLPGFIPSISIIDDYLTLLEHFKMEEQLSNVDLSAFKGFSTNDYSRIFWSSYPGISVDTPELTSLAEWRGKDNMDTMSLYNHVHVKLIKNLPFSPAELNYIANYLENIQYNTSVPTLSGLLATRQDWMDDSLFIPGKNQIRSSLESTLAGLETCNLLESFSNGSTFILDKIFDLESLENRLFSWYRESPSEGWFAREFPLDYQDVKGSLDSSRLEDTRLVLEILNLTGKLEDPLLLSSSIFKKILTMARNEPINCLTDLANKVRIFELVKEEFTDDDASQIINIVSSFRDNDTGQYLKAGMPSFDATVHAIRILSKFNEMQVFIDGINNDSQALEVFAGNTIEVSAIKFNFGTGMQNGISFSLSNDKLGVQDKIATSGNSKASLNVKIPLNETILGPSTMTIKMENVTFNQVLNLEITFKGILSLAYPEINNNTKVSEHLSKIIYLDLYLISPLDSSIKVPVKSGEIHAKGINMNSSRYFIHDENLTNSSMTFLAEVPINPTEQFTSYLIEASMNYCSPVKTIIKIKYSSSLVFVPFILIPLASTNIIIISISLKKQKRYY
ncbi:MAG: hypothetical protein ACTSXU_14250, partial [Promethearchaeota archaeon]